MKSTFHTLLAVVCLVLVGPALPDAAGGPQAAGGSSEKSIGDFGEVTPQLRAAVESGLDWLSNNVLSSANGAVGHPYPTAVTSLTGIAFLAHGDSPTRGKYSEALSRALNYIMAMARREPPGGKGPPNHVTGLIDTESQGERHPIMYSHGYASLFLAEAYGTTKNTELKRVLRNAVRLIERTQGPGGGWTYAPVSQGRNDMSVGVCQTMALRGARNVGIALSSKVVNMAIACAVRARTSRAVNKKGQMGFTYTSTAPGNGGPSFPVTCGTVALLYGLGKYEDNGEKTPEKNPGMLLEPALRYIMGQVGRIRGNVLQGGHRFYAVYYTGQALVQAGGEQYWGKGFPVLRDALLRMRNGDHWRMGGEVNPQFQTAIACIVLQIPYQYLPVFER